MILPQYMNRSDMPPPPRQERENPRPTPFQEEDISPPEGNQPHPQIFHPPMILPPHLSHSDFSPHQPHPAGEAQLASYEAEHADSISSLPQLDPDLHPPMILPQHLLAPTLLTQQQDKSNASGLSFPQPVYSENTSLPPSTQAASEGLGHREDDFCYAPYQGMDLFSATSAAPEADGFVWDINFSDIRVQDSMQAWATSSHEPVTSSAAYSAGMLRATQAGQDEMTDAAVEKDMGGFDQHATLHYDVLQMCTPTFFSPSQ